MTVLSLEWGLPMAYHKFSTILSKINIKGRWFYSKLKHQKKP